MPITEQQERMARETVQMLQERAADIKEPVRISPERMAAFHAAQRMRMQLTVGNIAIIIQEDESAPEFEYAIDEACGVDKDMQQPLIQATDCEECGGSTVVLKDGDVMCTACRLVRVNHAKQQIIEAQAAEETAERELREMRNQHAREMREELRKGPRRTH